MEKLIEERCFVEVRISFGIAKVNKTWDGVVGCYTVDVFKYSVIPAEGKVVD